VTKGLKLKKNSWYVELEALEQEKRAIESKEEKSADELQRLGWLQGEIEFQKALADEDLKDLEETNKVFEELKSGAMKRWGDWNNPFVVQYFQLLSTSAEKHAFLTRYSMGSREPGHPG
jgi:predicted  nucleic acid-binding Zn-ribbon protein